MVAGRDITLVTVVPPSGYAEEIKAAAEAAAAAAAAAATAAAAPAAAPALLLRLLVRPPRVPRRPRLVAAEKK